MGRLTCSACHTNEITYEGKRIRIEGAPALADFQSFMETLNKALVETKNNPDKAKRFRQYSKVYTPRPRD